MRRRNYHLNPAQLGHRFEDYVRHIFEANYYALVNKNKVMKNFNLIRDPATKREYDLVMFNWRENDFYIIECKAHYKQSTLSDLGQVKEFKDKLDKYNGRSAKRMIITNTYFTKQAGRYALRNNIIPVNGKMLARMEQYANTIKGRLIRMISRTIVSPALEKVEKVSASELEKLVDKLIRNYSV